MRSILKITSAMALAAMLSVGLSGCGGGNPLKNEELPITSEGKVVYETGLQYVKIVKRDMEGVANDHPFSISEANLRTVLESLYVSETVLFKERQSELFSPYEVQILSRSLASALARAESSEDVTFVTLGKHKTALAEEQHSNSARIFISGGRLNMVFGTVRQLFEEKQRGTNQEIDRRLNPILPGSRKTDSEPALRVALDNGQSYYIDPRTGKERTDWIVIDIPTVLATMAGRTAESNEGFLSPELKEDIARNKQETKNLRQDMANIKEVLFEMSDKLDKLQKELDTLKAQ
jgi:hypothetical protein